VAALPSLDIPRILERIAAGDTPAFGEIVVRYQKPLFGFLGRLGLSQAQAEDIAQETFLRAWRSLATFEPGRAEFSTWLFTIARNAALNERARASAHGEVPHGNETAHEPACEEPLPPDALQASRRREWLQAALLRLQPTDRTVVALFYTRELPLDAIARIEGCTTGAIKTRLHRARQQLQQLLMENADEH